MTPAIVYAQQEESQFKLVQFYMVLLKKGLHYDDQDAVAEQVHQGHFTYVLSLMDSGKAVVFGSLSDGGELINVCILRTKSADEAKSQAESDPAVKAGHLIAEIHPWWSEDVFKKQNSPLKIDTVYLAFLKKGPNRKDGDDQVPEIQELQKAHIANIQRLAKLGKLVVAGPFGDDGILRGIFVFRVGSLAEAQELCATDPMIKIDRLRVELHPWNVPGGVLP
jgi:uncharacterized protein YciI